MKCEPHGTDGCQQCKPAMAAMMRAGDLRRAIAHLADDALVVVNAADPQDPAVCHQQVITSAGPGTVGWGDGYGLEPDGLFALNADFPEDELLVKPDRPRRPA